MELLFFFLFVLWIIRAFIIIIIGIGITQWLTHYLFNLDIEKTKFKTALIGDLSSIGLFVFINPLLTYKVGLIIVLNGLFFHHLPTFQKKLGIKLINEEYETIYVSFLSCLLTTVLALNIL